MKYSIVLGALLLLLSGCAPPIVEGHRINLAQEYCEDKDGIDYMNMFMSDKVTCNDGSEIFIANLLPSKSK